MTGEARFELARVKSDRDEEHVDRRASLHVGDEVGPVCNDEGVLMRKLIYSMSTSHYSAVDGGRS